MTYRAAFVSRYPLIFFTLSRFVEKRSVLDFDGVNFAEYGGMHFRLYQNVSRENISDAMTDCIIAKF